MSTPTYTDEDRLESIADRLRAIGEQMSQLKQAEADLQAQARLIIGEQVGEIVANGKPVLTVSYSKRFSPERAEQLFAASPETLKSISREVVVPSLAKRVLPPAAYEMCQVASDNPTIKPKVAK